MFFSGVVAFGSQGPCGDESPLIVSVSTFKSASVAFPFMDLCDFFGEGTPPVFSLLMLDSLFICTCGWQGWC